jgi:hypothetical protein
MTSAIAIALFCVVGWYAGVGLYHLSQWLLNDAPATEPTCKNIWCSLCKDRSPAGCPGCQQRVGP